eukprot:936231_1
MAVSMLFETMVHAHHGYTTHYSIQSCMVYVHNFAKQPPPVADEETDDDDESTDESIDRNDFLDQFWHQMPPNKTKQEIPLNSPLNFDFLFKTASDNFIKNIKTNMKMQIYDYVGSLRTPPYTQGVKWFISKKTHFINTKQLNTLKKIWYHYL